LDTISDFKRSYSRRSILLNICEVTYKIELYNEVAQELLGGGLDGTGEHGHGIDGLLALEVTLEDPFANDHQSGVGSGIDQSVNNDLAVEYKRNNY